MVNSESELEQRFGSGELVSTISWIIGLVRTSVRRGGCSASEEEKVPAQASWQKTLQVFQGGQEEAPTYFTWNPLCPLLQ